MPIIDSSKPMHAANAAFNADLPATAATMVKASSISEK